MGLSIFFKNFITKKIIVRSRKEKINKNNLKFFFTISSIFLFLSNTLKLFSIELKLTEEKMLSKKIR